MSFYEALYAAQPDDEVNMLKRQWQDGGGLHFNAAMGAEFIPGARNALNYEKPEAHHAADLTCGVAHGNGDADVCSGCEFTVASPTADSPSMHRHGVAIRARARVSYPIPNPISIPIPRPSPSPSPSPNPNPNPNSKQARRPAGGPRLPRGDARGA